MMQEFHGLLDIIKSAALDAVRASKPVEVRFGTVAKETPLTVEIDQRLTISARDLVIFKGQTIKKGAKVAILRLQGGEKFIVLGEVT